MYPNEIMQVILNLLKNSEYNFLDKYTEKPEIMITTFNRNNKTIVSICDNGGGIPANIAKKIFEPYFSTKSEKNGTGLGLYMSKIIIEEHHNGSLMMKNRNDGVCFEMIFKT
jgi:nitrogen fixation/metabolism regulation signal transduction histidine kinase